MNINSPETRRVREKGERERQRVSLPGCACVRASKCNCEFHISMQICLYVYMCVCACNCHACIWVAVCCCFCICYYNNYLKNTPISASASTAPAKLFKCFCVRGLQVKSNTHMQTYAGTNTALPTDTQKDTHAQGALLYNHKNTHNSSHSAAALGRCVSQGLCMCVCECGMGKGMRGCRIYVPCVPESGRVPG